MVRLHSTQATPKSSRHERIQTPPIETPLPDLQVQSEVGRIRAVLFRALPRQGSEPMVQRWLLGARQARRSRRDRTRTGLSAKSNAIGLAKRRSLRHRPALIRSPDHSPHGWSAVVATPG